MSRLLNYEDQIRCQENYLITYQSFLNWKMSRFFSILTPLNNQENFQYSRKLFNYV